MNQVAIEALLRRKIGLDAIAIGSNTIARAVRQRMVVCGLTDSNAYLNRLQTSFQELAELIEAVVVPETWFFRDREPFVFLSRYVRDEWCPAHPNNVLRVLSAPCATGEEPYSIAITLMEAGLSAENFCIDALDISQKALYKARKAVYGRNSFRVRSLDLPLNPGFSLQERYFTPLDNEYQLHPSVSSTVNFIQGNLLHPFFLLKQDPYDIIFCRNVLIYFDRLAKERTVRCLGDLLKNQGLLFLGSAEAGQLSPGLFRRVPHPFAFAYQKLEGRTSTSPCKNHKEKISPLSTPPTNYGHAPQTETPTAQPCTHVSLSPLETARHLADQGKLAEAVTLCEAYLSQNRTSAEAYILLGQVRQAAGHHAQAEQCFQKSIYLEPDRYEALMHLALLKEHRGDLAGAAIVRQRMQRLKNKIS
jgi:chemotaxis protein methyltransferase WspC